MDRNVKQSRKLGRPSTMSAGKITAVYLDSDSKELARLLGSGNASLGIRLALKFWATRMYDNNDQFPSFQS